MSDITHARRADARLTDGDVPAASVHATLAVGRALREIDSKVGHVGKEIAGALWRIAPDTEDWLTWGDDDNRQAVSVRAVSAFRQQGDETVLLTFDGTEITIPLSYGAVAHAVGA